MHRVLGVVFLAGCIAQASAALNPPAAGGGSLTCREIVEQCDAQCTDPMCVRRCGDQGTPEAAQQHNAVVDCAQRNGCTDEPCIRAACGPEASVCQGPEPVSPPAAEPEPEVAPS
ncbi:MAG: hypothetical protein ABI867_40100 [Kofleriaceae bacterium]